MKEKIITGAENKLFKYAKSLHSKKNREENGEYLIEGLRFVKDALINKIHIKYIFVSENFNMESIELLISEESEIKIYTLTDKLMKAISDTENPQGIVAIVKKQYESLEDIDLKKLNDIAIIDRVQDPGNLGTIIRTADAFGISAVFLLKGTVDLYNMKTVRSTMGSIFHLPIVYIEDSNKLFDNLVNLDYDILITHLNGEKTLDTLSLSSKSAFVIGNEANGVSENVMKYSNKLVKIPMEGKAESLNAAVAAAIVMYEIMVKRKEQ